MALIYSSVGAALLMAGTLQLIWLTAHLGISRRYRHPATLWLCLGLTGMVIRMGKSSLNAFIVLPEWMLNVGLAGMLLAPPALYAHRVALAGGRSFPITGGIGLAVAIGFAIGAPWIPNSRGDEISMAIYVAILAWGYAFVVAPDRPMPTSKVWAAAVRAIVAVSWSMFLLVFVTGSEWLYLAWCALFATGSSALMLIWFGSRQVSDFYARMLRASASDTNGSVAPGYILDLLAKPEFYQDPDLTLARFARRIGIPEKRISATIGRIPPHHFRGHLNVIRVMAAQDALRAGWSGSMTELAERVGYNSPSAFSRAFRAIAGVSPSEWKAMSSQA